MTLQIAVVQFQPQRQSVRSNIEKIQSLLDGLKADLVVLPELANSGYLYESPEELLPFSEPKDGRGEFLTAMSGIAKNMGGVIVTGYAEKQANRLFNSAAAMGPDGLLANYRKIH